MFGEWHAGQDETSFSNLSQRSGGLGAAIGLRCQCSDAVEECVLSSGLLGRRGYATTPGQMSFPQPSLITKYLRPDARRIGIGPERRRSR